MFYGVYFYETIRFSGGTFLVGFYDNIDDAKKRLEQIIPDYKKHINNTVINNNRIGWINEYNMGDFKFDLYNGLNVSQPHSSIDIFKNMNEN